MPNDKVSKSSVHYSRGMPKSHCGICDYFINKDHACEKVEGIIMPSMWCKLFKKEI
jgi:hypothetical protein